MRTLRPHPGRSSHLVRVSVRLREGCIRGGGDEANGMDRSVTKHGFFHLARRRRIHFRASVSGTGWIKAAPLPRPQGMGYNDRIIWGHHTPSPRTTIAPTFPDIGPP